MNRFEKWVFPPTCVVTGEAGQEVDVSARVQAQLVRPVQACSVCAMPLAAATGKPLHSLSVCGACLSQPPSFDLTQAGFRFDGWLVDSIHGLKYHSQLYQARLLAELWHPYLDVTGVDALVPVPLHSSRLLERGFNQSLELAQALSKLTGIPVRPWAVQRVRATPYQALLKAQARHHNLKGAFALLDTAQLQGLKQIALVDDVMTTGATVEQLAAVVKRSFPSLRIQVWVLARAVGH
ncbi:MAG: ComF family protein [Hydrogenovibrio sp.]